MTDPALHAPDVRMMLTLQVKLWHDMKLSGKPSYIYAYQRKTQRAPRGLDEHVCLLTCIIYIDRSKFSS